jgi:hypothetical protein
MYKRFAANKLLEYAVINRLMCVNENSEHIRQYLAIIMAKLRRSLYFCLGWRVEDKLADFNN